VHCPWLKTLGGVVLVVALLSGAASSSAAQSDWRAEFTRDVTGFKRVAQGNADLWKTEPLFESQFNAFEIYAGELKAEGRQLEALRPPRRCSEVQEDTVKLLWRAAWTSKALGEAKNYTSWEFEHGGEKLRKLPSRLGDARREAENC